MFNNRLLAGTLLVTGTTIGGGMLALPVSTAPGGFFPSLVIYLICWSFMASTGLLFLEVALWGKKGANIVSMAEFTLGPFGKAVAWGLYIFLFYCLTLAYIDGCSGTLRNIFQGIFSQEVFMVLFVLATLPLVYFGANLIGHLNGYFMIALAVLYVLFVVLGLPYVDLSLLTRADWGRSTLALPIAFTAFSYHGIVPTLVEFLHYKERDVRTAILVGSFIPLVAYSIWQFLILGTIPYEGEGGLAQAMSLGQTAIEPFKNFVKHPSVYLIGQCFAFIALITSFFGVTLGLLDFLADGLKVEKNNSGKAGLCLLIFVPTLLLALYNPHAFLTALEYAGGFGCALLLGLLPILMVWRGRYTLHLTGPYTYPGGKSALRYMMGFVVLEVVFQTMHLLTR